jgi:hypothetical protein
MHDASDICRISCVCSRAREDAGSRGTFTVYMLIGVLEQVSDFRVVRIQRSVAENQEEKEKC